MRESVIRVYQYKSIAILSNSVGSKDDAPDFRGATEVEKTLALPVIRHNSKKPAVRNEIM